MKILGISSATKVISIGLIDEEKVLVETTVSDLHAEKIMLYVKEAGIEPKQIEGVVVAVGPGSYAGLRGGLAVAKSLAQTLNVPLTGISTLEAIAYNLIDIEGTMAVILDAKADEYNFALFGASKGELKRLTDDLVLKFDHMMEKLSRISGEIYLAGNIKGIREPLDFSRGKQGIGNRDNFHLAEDIHSHPYGINVARLGLSKIKAGQIEDPLKLVPSYSHKPNIREFKSK
jgi:tRNA threonylcarbamoyladenosine biosynthesis protein TsaB